MAQIFVGVGMHRGRAQHKSVAWLAMLAMCLLVFAPCISRIISGNAMALSMGMDGICSEHAHTTPHSPRDRHRDTMDACGYCVLISHGTMLCDTVVLCVPSMPLAFVFVVQPVGRRIAAAVVQRRLARGPPASFEHRAVS
ncbi:DUF2946 domain-containing protein [Dyella sp. M7H15-1]|uniref:DUF2946 domain-containing protein n=1 Tax=Dyella sp. M7H15-1 TaxID=2501295 RepID=UPI0010051F45|nr:DUF2946 domain-containing protein [Dyella sp. M7H15-1]QAU23985.1 DUF2946 domain-containing protein [Dyella sp. M7H15-1]